MEDTDEKSGKENDVSFTPIEDLDLSVRAYNCLKRAGVISVEKLRTMTDEDLMHVRNLGRKCVDEIKRKLVEINELTINVPLKEASYMDMLNDLIGLKDVKEQVRKIAAFARMKKDISECQILALSGGFSSGDEPDGSGKFIANVLNNKEIADEIHKLIDRGGLILGICNGFQALVKSGLLPYGRLGCVTKDSPTLFRNDINRHISQMVTTRLATTRSPWLAGLAEGDLFTIAVSHGEGKFVVNEELAKQLFENGQVAFQYVNPVTEEPTMESPYNPNGSYYAIEGIISPDGQILGKMGHTERYEPGLFKNIDEELEQPLFRNAVKYFTKK